jgi:hypothetical protein
MVKFSELKFRPHSQFFMEFGVCAQHTTDNGYTASIVKFPGSHGFRDGLYEMAIIKDGVIDFNNEFTPVDVLGHLTTEDVENFIEQMGLLDPKTGCLPEGIERYRQKGEESEQSMKDTFAFLDYLT